MRAVFTNKNDSTKILCEFSSAEFEGYDDIALSGTVYLNTQDNSVTLAEIEDVSQSVYERFCLECLRNGSSQALLDYRGCIYDTADEENYLPEE